MEVVDVRLKRVDFVPEISSDVYRRMESERKRAANEERAKGQAWGVRTVESFHTYGTPPVT